MNGKHRRPPSYAPEQLLRRKCDGEVAVYVGPATGPWKRWQTRGVVRFLKPTRFGSDFNVALCDFELVDMIQAIGGLA